MCVRKLFSEIAKKNVSKFSPVTQSAIQRWQRQRQQIADTCLVLAVHSLARCRRHNHKSRQPARWHWRDYHRWAEIQWPWCRLEISLKTSLCYEKYFQTGYSQSRVCRALGIERQRLLQKSKKFWVGMRVWLRWSGSHIVNGYDMTRAAEKHFWKFNFCSVRSSFSFIRDGIPVTLWMSLLLGVFEFHLYIFFFVFCFS